MVKGVVGVSNSFANLIKVMRCLVSVLVNSC
jgi:hypothetical protein